MCGKCILILLSFTFMFFLCSARVFFLKPCSYDWLGDFICGSWSGFGVLDRHFFGAISSWPKPKFVNVDNCQNFAVDQSHGIVSDMVLPRTFWSLQRRLRQRNYVNAQKVLQVLESTARSAQTAPS